MWQNLPALLHVYGNSSVGGGGLRSGSVRFEAEEIQMLTFISIGSRLGIMTWERK